MEAVKPVIAVACGVLQNDTGQVLLAQRPEGKIAEGYWEFPGGKIEPGEAPRAALDRELHEELGIEVRAARPLIRFRHEYSNRVVLLDTWLITHFSGQPHGREAQRLAWVYPSALEQQSPLLPTVAPIRRALLLPTDYVFTAPEQSLEAVRLSLNHLPRGALLRLRRPDLSDQVYAATAAALLPHCTDSGLHLILDRDPHTVLALGAAGWHATSAAMARLQHRPLPSHLWCFASCHQPEELTHAAALQFDAAVLGPVRPTPTHPDAAGIGWEVFAQWAGTVPLPVYALGGVGPGQKPEAFAAYAQGTAGISAYWGRGGQASPSSEGGSSCSAGML